MPFAALGAPSAALSALKAGLAEHGVDCQTAYLNVAFADALGNEVYDLIAERLPSGLLSGDWAFAGCLFGELPGARDDYFATTARRLGNEERRSLSKARDAAPGFIDAQLSEVQWGDYDLVGFTSSFGQNAASLAIARRLKESYPSIILVVGGANWEAAMGIAQLQRFPFIDVAFLGEADLSLPALVDKLARCGDMTVLPIDDVPGIAYRDSTGVHRTGGEAHVEDLDALATPDFSDFFSALEASAKRRDPREVHIWLQGSRGCWWAERHPCRFCGLNGSRRPYSAMTSERLLDIIRGVTARWPGCPVDLADTVISPAFLDHAVSLLAAQPLGVPLSVEARPELRREQVRNVARAGGEVQVGIESLSENALRLMGKGSHVLECLRLLRWCRDDGLYCSWNILYDIPGETNEDLAEMVRLIPALHSLPAPGLCLPMQLDRFSPFFDHPSQYDIEDVRPSEAYAHVYPWSDEALRGFAYMWDFRRDRSLLRRARIRRLKDEVRLWQDDAEQCTLALRRSGPISSIAETRPGADDRVIELDDLDLTLYEACDDIGALDDLVRVVLHGVVGSRVTGETEKLVISRLRRLVDERIMVEVDGRYLSLAHVAPGAAGEQAV